MKIIICDNCGEQGNENYWGNFCDKCLAQWRIKKEKVEALKTILDNELKNKFHIR